MTLRRAAAALVAGCWAALAAAAPLDAHLAARGGELTAALGLAPAFPADLERRLGNGLTNVVALHVTLAPEAGGAPAALWAREVQVLYDVWEETFGVVVRDPATPRGRRLTFPTFHELRRFLFDVRVPLGPAAALGEARWVVAARVELNPVSRELVERTRELIANPAAGGRTGPSRSVLGAMAGFLLREPPAGAEVRALRSAPFDAAEVRAR